MLRALLSGAVTFALILAFTPQAIGQDAEKTDLFALVLVASDLQDASRLMTIFDPNEDGLVDKE